MTNDLLPDEKLASTWTQIQEAIRTGLAATGSRPEDQPLSKIVTLSSGSADLTHYLNYSTNVANFGLSPGVPPGRSAGVEWAFTVDASLDHVYELRFENPLPRGEILDANDKLRNEKALSAWGQGLRAAEHDWVLRQLIGLCEVVATLSRDEEWFQDAALALRVIPFRPTTTDDLKKLPVPATLTIADPVALPSGLSPSAVMIVRIGHGRAVVRIEDFDLAHQVGQSTVTVIARARYQLADFAKNAGMGKLYSKLDLSSPPAPPVVQSVVAMDEPQ